jgi:hypothetical protein
MTTEQIAELEADSRDTQLYIPAATLVRLLEERKQLLAAVNAMGGCMHCGGQDNRGVAAAVDFAEGEAP